ncbi:MAG: hypothetical protein IKZ82_08430 [Clostridia bacterium]|nr:hypothetical protein [Clostridia bacterium]
MKRSVKIILVAIALLAILFSGLKLSSSGRRAEAMFGGAVLILRETATENDA